MLFQSIYNVKQIKMNVKYNFIDSKASEENYGQEHNWFQFINLSFKKLTREEKKIEL